jgi:hypothetical protein
MANAQMQAAIKELQDAVVMAHLETPNRASGPDRGGSGPTERLSPPNRKRNPGLRKESERFRQRTDENLAEITDKLNGLIGYIESQRPGESLKTLAN